MTERSVVYTIAFAKDENTLAYREQAKLMIESLVDFGEWQGPIVVFTNLAGRRLRDEMPARLAARVNEIIVDFSDFSCGKDGKLPSARFRMKAWAFFNEWRHADWVLYLDTDVIVRRPLADLLNWGEYSITDIGGATVAKRNMGQSKWFNGHITPQYQHAAKRQPGVQSGTILFRGGQTFQKICSDWTVIDEGPHRDTEPHLVTDQSSHNLLHLRCLMDELPWRAAWMPVKFVSCPHDGQRRALGHDAINESAIWHYWHIRSQDDRVVAMRSELDRLQCKGVHLAPLGLLGTWRHQKVKEKILNQWTFHSDGLITVDEPAICGRWEWRDDHVLVDWLWGWEKVFVYRDSIIYGLTNLIGESFRNGTFLLSKL